jgi:hypothetical protein
VYPGNESPAYVFTFSLVELQIANRKCFAHHGLHLNGRGGKSISKQIAVQISAILGKKVEDTISLDWESERKERATA